LQFKYTFRQLILRINIKHSTNAKCIRFAANIDADSVFKIMWQKNKQFTLHVQLMMTMMMSMKINIVSEEYLYVHQ